MNEMYTISVCRVIDNELMSKHSKRDYITKLNKAIEELERLFPQQK